MNIQWMMRLKALWYLGISVEKATETLQHTSPHTTEKMVTYWYNAFNTQAAL